MDALLDPAPTPHARPLRVLHIINSTHAGGAETMLCEVLARLRDRRFEFQVVALLGHGPLTSRLEKLGIPVHALNLSRNGLVHPVALLQLVRILRREQPDVVQTWMYAANLLGGLVSAMATAAPVVWGIHHSSHDPEIDTRNTLRFARWGARLSRRIPQRVVLVSKAAWPVHARLGYDIKKLHVVPNGFDTQKFKPSEYARKRIRTELELPENAIAIGMVARFDPLKDHANFVAAAAEVARQQPDAHFVLAGRGIDWSNVPLAESIRVQGLESRFQLLGPRNDVAKLFAALDMVVSASVSEAFPLVVGEAMACGLPCVVTDVGDSSFIVGGTGQVVPPRKSLALAEAILRLAQMPVIQRRELGLRARQRIVAHFGIDQAADRYGELWTQAAGRREAADSVGRPTYRPRAAA